MTYPCVNPDQIDATDGVLSPQPWMQYRQVATAEAASKAGTYPVAGGGAKNDLLQTLGASWTNNSPLAQLVYGLVTRGGAVMTLQARSRGYLAASHGIEITTGTPAVAEVSRFGVGLDVGSGGTFGNETAYGIAEYRQNSHTMPLLPQQTGWLRVDPGQTVTARVELRFVSDFWESRAITNGEQGSESSYITGDTRLDLFALPVL
ncbi:hypothetical protein SEA_CAIB_33 [Gordonia phage CaiB]|nr:hypothetical protein SEA_ANARQUE_33 [Gordonia phage AnarQue]UOW93017.1 hypothetical protein SEA_CAIB_33 [Gordonia phage CaiB]